MSKVLKHRNKVLSSRFLIFIPEKMSAAATHTGAGSPGGQTARLCRFQRGGRCRPPPAENEHAPLAARAGRILRRSCVCVTATCRKALWISVSVFSRRVPYRRSYRSVRLYRYRARGRRIPDLRFRCRRAWHLSVSLRLRRVLS